MKFVLATTNPGKIREMREIFTAPGIELLTRQELGIDLNVDETGATFLENALLKAAAICNAAGLAAIADDSGLMVGALGGAPGVYSSSYGGESLDDGERCLYLLDKMKGLEQRDAKFVCTIVCMFPDGSTLAARGECLGEIAYAPRGAGGFGYDPIFLVKGRPATMAELPPDEKNAISHRGMALREFARLIAPTFAAAGDLR